MRNVPWWGVVSSAIAPVLLVGGWTVATRLQPPTFNPITDTVSSLAAVGAACRWVMTATFVMVAICNLVTAAALRPAGAPGRLILAAGSVAGILVALNPDHLGGSVPHAVWASIGFSGMALWPAGAWRRGPSVPWGLRPAASACAVGVLLALTAWFAAELVTGAGAAGLAERIVGAAQALWLLTVVLSCRFPSRVISRSTTYARRPVRNIRRSEPNGRGSTPDHLTSAWSRVVPERSSWLTEASEGACLHQVQVTSRHP